MTVDYRQPDGAKPRPDLTFLRRRSRPVRQTNSAIADFVAGRASAHASRSATPPPPPATTPPPATSRPPSAPPRPARRSRAATAGGCRGEHLVGPDRALARTAVGSGAPDVLGRQHLS